MSKIVEFFDKVEEMLKGKKRSILEKGMGLYTSKKIGGAFLFVEMDLLVLIFLITGVAFDECSIILLVSIGIIAAGICRHYLNKRIKAQETEELAEDLEDDIARIAYTIAIVALIVFLVLAWLLYK